MFDTQSFFFCINFISKWISDYIHLKISLPFTNIGRKKSVMKKKREKGDDELKKKKFLKDKPPHLVQLTGFLLFNKLFKFPIDCFW